MRTLPHLSRITAILCAVAISACGGGELGVNLTLVVKTCSNNPDVDPLAGAVNLKFTVYGEGIDAIDYQTRVPISGASVEIPSIPPGLGRNVVVEALTTGAGGEAPVARGETGPMDFTGKDTAPTAVVFLRRLESFTPTSSQSVEACSQMTTPRAGHTATLLSDGRVLLVGGYFDLLEGSVLKRHYLRSTEIYNPRTGQFSQGADLNNARLYHTATFVPGTTYTVVAGGEFDPKPDSIGAALASGEIFDERTGTFAVKALKEARTKHAAAVPPRGGRVMLIGGYNAGGVALSSTEQFNPQTRLFEEGPRLPAGSARGQLSAIGVGDGKVLAVGGYDGRNPLKDVLLFVARTNTGNYDLAADFSMQLTTPRVLPLLAALEDGRVLVTGGFSGRPEGTLHSSATNVTDLIDIEARTAKRPALGLTKPRGLGGATTLLDGSVAVFAGGQLISGKPVANADADIIYPQEREPEGLKLRSVRPSAKLAQGRYQAAYTLLNDGSVLVTGGITYDADGKPTFLQTAEMFQPYYQSSAKNAYR